jgi:hypothetical protein
MMKLILAPKSMEEIKEKLLQIRGWKIRQNTPKIMKKKNDPYNLEMRFTYKDQLYWENQTCTRYGNYHNILPLFGGLERSLTFSPLLTYTMKHAHTSQKATMVRGWEWDDWVLTSPPAFRVLFIGKTND